MPPANPNPLGGNPQARQTVFNLGAAMEDGAADPFAPKATAKTGGPRTVFGKRLQKSKEADPDAFVAESEDIFEKSKEHKEVRMPRAIEREERVKAQWDEFCEAIDIPEADRLLGTTFLERARHYLGMMLQHTRVAKKNGLDEDLVQYSTLLDWATALCHHISAHAHDREGRRIGPQLLSKEGLFRKIIDECKALRKKFSLDRYLPEPIFWGRYELQYLLEAIMRDSPSMEVGIQLCEAIAVEWVTMLRAGSLAYSFKQWDENGEQKASYLKYEDLRIDRHPTGGRGAFNVRYSIKHLKYRNGDQITNIPLIHVISLKMPENAIFDPNNYTIPRLFHDKMFPKWVDKTYDEFLDGDELTIEISEPSRPVYRKINQGGYGLDPVRPIAAKRLSLDISQRAINSGLRAPGRNKGSSRNFRKDGGSEMYDRSDQATAAKALLHHGGDAENCATIHYTHGVAAIDYAGIRSGEAEFGDAARLERTRAMHVFRGPAMQARALRIMERNLRDNPEEEELEDDLDDKPTRKTTRNGLDTKEERAKIQETLNSSPTYLAHVKDLDDAIEALREVTDLPFNASNNWKYLLDDESEETPDPGASDLHELWGQPTIRKQRAALYGEMLGRLQTFKKKATRKIRDDRRREEATQRADMMKVGSVKALQAAVEKKDAPSSLVLKAVSFVKEPAAVEREEDVDQEAVEREDIEQDVEQDAEPIASSSKVPAPPPKAPIHFSADQRKEFEASFWLGRIGRPENTRVAPDPVRSLVMNALNEDDDASTTADDDDATPVVGKRKRPSAKGKGKGKEIETEPTAAEDAADVAAAALADTEGLDSTVVINDPKLGEFNETRSTSFNTNRTRELKTAGLEGVTGEEMRVAYQKMVLAALASDEDIKTKPCPRCVEHGDESKLYTRSKLKIHKEASHDILDKFLDKISISTFLEKATKDGVFKCFTCGINKTWKSPGGLYAHIKKDCEGVERDEDTDDGAPPGPKRRRSNVAGKATSTRKAPAGKATSTRKAPTSKSRKAASPKSKTKKGKKAAPRTALTGTQPSSSPLRPKRKSAASTGSPRKKSKASASTSAIPVDENDVDDNGDPEDQETPTVSPMRRAKRAAAPTAFVPEQVDGDGDDDDDDDDDVPIINWGKRKAPAPKARFVPDDDDDDDDDDDEGGWEDVEDE